MHLSFKNQVALVTGAASGIGLVTAKAFAEAGAAVTLADINEDGARSAAEALVAAGHRAIGVRCDVAEADEVAAMVGQTVSTFGRVDAASTMQAFRAHSRRPAAPAPGISVCVPRSTR